MMRLIYFILKNSIALFIFIKHVLSLYIKIINFILKCLVGSVESFIYWWLFKPIVRTKALWILFFKRAICSFNMYLTLDKEEIKKYFTAYSSANGIRYFLLRTEFLKSYSEEKNKETFNIFQSQISNLKLDLIIYSDNMKAFKIFKIKNMTNIINKSNIPMFIKNFIIRKNSILWCLVRIYAKYEIKKENNTEKREKLIKLWSGFKETRYLIKEIKYKLAVWEEFSEDNRFKYWDMLYFWAF